MPTLTEAQAAQSADAQTRNETTDELAHANPAQTLARTKARDRWRANAAQRRATARNLLAQAAQSATARFALCAGIIVVAGANFTLSSFGLFDFGVRVMRLPAGLAWLVPVGIDFGSVMAIAGIWILRNAKWYVRLYGWAVYAVPTLCSIGANAAHAQKNGLDPAGVLAFALAPVMVSLFMHFLVVVRRATERASSIVAQVRKETRKPAPARKTQTEEPSAPRANPTPEPARKLANGARVNGSAQLVLGAYTPGASAPEVRKKLAQDGYEIPLRTIQNYLKNLKENAA